jgi:hypothetical protein
MRYERRFLMTRNSLRGRAFRSVQPDETQVHVKLAGKAEGQGPNTSASPSTFSRLGGWH